MRKTAGVVLALVGFAPILLAQPFQWETFTSTSDVLDIESVNGHLWAATTGGLIHFDPQTGMFDVYTNTRGLSTNRCVAVGADSRGGIWVGLEDRRLNRLDPETGRVDVLSDLQGDVYAITDLVPWEDYIFVATDVGAYRLAYYETVNGFRVQESYSKLGGLSPRTEVRRLAVADGYLWAATAFGLARADLALPTLVPPSAWENIDESDGLPDADVRAILAAPDGGLWIGMSVGLVLWRDGSFGAVRDFGTVVDFGNVNDTVYIATSNRTYWYDPAFGWRYATDPTTLDVRRLAGAPSGENGQVLWAAVAHSEDRSGGIAALLGEEWTEPLRAEGPAGNDISALAVGPDGRLWVGGKGERGGVST